MAPPRSALPPGSLRQPGAVPAAVPGDELVGLGGTPRSLLIAVNRGRRVQQRLQYAPALLDAVLPREAGALSDHRRVEQDLVRGRALPSLLGELHVQVDRLGLDVLRPLRVEDQAD